MPFISDYNRREKFIFWRDQTTSHYAKTVMDWRLDTKAVKYVPKWSNPIKVSKYRPIEDFWALIKRDVYKDGYKRPNLKVLRRKINEPAQKVDQILVQRLTAELSSASTIFIEKIINNNYMVHLKEKFYASNLYIDYNCILNSANRPTF